METLPHAQRIFSVHWQSCITIYIDSQPKLNKKHAKWVEFLQNFTFVIKHTSGKANKVVGELSSINLILQDFQVSTLGFEGLKEMFRDDANFKDA